MQKVNCRVPICKSLVSPKILMCAEHWSKVPEQLRVDVLTHYKAGQEKGKIRPSAQYLKAVRAAIASVYPEYASSIPMIDELAEKESKAVAKPKWDSSKFKRQLDPL